MIARHRKLGNEGLSASRKQTATFVGLVERTLGGHYLPVFVPILRTIDAILNPHANDICSFIDATVKVSTLRKGHSKQ